MILNGIKLTYEPTSPQLPDTHSYLTPHEDLAHALISSGWCMSEQLGMLLPVLRQ